MEHSGSFDDERNPTRPDLDPSELTPAEIASEAIRKDEDRDREHMSEVAETRDKVVRKGRIKQDPQGDEKLTPDEDIGPVGELSS